MCPGSLLCGDQVGAEARQPSVGLRIRQALVEGGSETPQYGLGGQCMGILDFGRGVAGHRMRVEPCRFDSMRTVKRRGSLAYWLLNLMDLIARHPITQFDALPTNPDGGEARQGMSTGSSCLLLTPLP